MYSKENSYEKYEYHVYEYEYISKISMFFNSDVRASSYDEP